VLRTEIIALHQAHLAVGNGTKSPVGAEFYPQCVSLSVEGNGARSVEGGVDARRFYRGDDKGIAYRTLHETREHADYVVPGPKIWEGL
jgi:cellulase